MRRSRNCSPRKASARSRKSPTSISTISPRSRASTRKPLRKSSRARRAISAAIEAEYDEARKALGVADELKTIEGLTTADAGQARRERGQDGRGPRRLRHRRSRRMDRARRVGEQEARRAIWANSGFPARRRTRSSWPRACAPAGSRPPPSRRPAVEEEEALAKRGGVAGLRARDRQRTKRDRSGPASCPAARDRRTTMLRFALSAEGAVVPDIRQKLPGRGVWTRLSARSCVRPRRKQAFSRGFRASVRAGADLADEVDGLLGAGRAAVSLARQQGRARHRRRRQGRGGDPRRRLESEFGGADTGVRRRARRRAKLQTLLDGVLGDRANPWRE